MSKHAMQLRFGKVNKNITNTNVFEHAGRVYAVAESHQPQEICIQNLETGNTWAIHEEWDRPCTSHPNVLTTGSCIHSHVSCMVNKNTRGRFFSAA